MRGTLRVLAAALVVAAAFPPSASASEGASPPGVDQAIAFLVSRQQPNGAFFAASATADAVAEATAVVAALGGPEPVVDRALAFVAEHGPQRAAGRGGHAARLVLGLVASGRDPASFEGHDYVAALRAHHNPVTGTYDTGMYSNALAALGLAAAGLPLPERTYDYFRLGRCSDGGLSHEAGCLQPADTDTTSLTLIALRAGGRARDDEVVAGARSYLLAARNVRGGWGLEAGAPTNANSTGLAISAIVALGEDPAGAPWTSGARSPLRALRSLQHRSGGFSYLAGQAVNDYATVQATPGLAGLTYPLRVARAGARAGGQLPGRTRVLAGGPARAQEASPAPTSTLSEKDELRERRQQRVEEGLGGRTQGGGGRVAVLWLSMLAAGALIAVPTMWKRRRRA